MLNSVAVNDHPTNPTTTRQLIDPWLHALNQSEQTPRIVFFLLKDLIRWIFIPPTNQINGLNSLTCLLLVTSFIYPLQPHPIATLPFLISQETLALNLSPFLQPWLVPSKPLVSPPEERLLASNSPPRYVVIQSPLFLSFISNTDLGFLIVFSLLDL
jgi:hypothetical protein